MPARPRKRPKRQPVKRQSKLAAAVKRAGGAGKWARAASVKELEDAVTAAKQAYYNSATPLVTDAVFDELFDVLKERAPRSPALGTGAKVRSKVKLPVSMGSLDKAKDADDLGRWAARQDADRYVIMDKLDGVSFLLHHSHGGDLRLFTRGDGRHGQDISAWLDALGLPVPKAGTAVRGELIMGEARFNAVWAKHAANARNLVSGLVNRKKLHDGLKDVHAVGYELIGAKMSPEAQLRKLKADGWRIPAFKVTNQLDAEKITNMLVTRKAKSPYRLDGLVLSVNEPRPRPRSGNPSYSVAFKKNLESDAAVVEVEDVVWRETRYGRIHPRVKIKPTRMGGVTVSYANGHNAAYIRKEGIGPGAKVKAIRAGDTIPYIMEVIKPVEPKMPGVPYEWEGLHTVVPKGDAGKEAELRATEFFFSSLGIEGIKYGTVSKLDAAGYETLIDIVRMPEDEMVDVLGRAGGRRLAKALDALYGSGVRLDKLLVASGLFPGVGRTRFAQMVEAVPDVMAMHKADLKEELEGLPGWGGSLVSTVLGGLPAFKRFAKDVDLEWSTDPSTGSMAGEVILFTGFRDKGLAAAIEAAGGRVAGNWSAKVTVLVTKDGSSTSAKAKAARRSGVPIMGPDELRERFDL